MKMSKKGKDNLVESAASRSKRKPKNDYSWVESDMSEDDEVSGGNSVEGFRTWSETEKKQNLSGLNPEHSIIH